MKDYMEYYRRNKQLDKIYFDKYNESESKYYEKNCLGLIVELGELANESKCFKYWTVKKPNMENLLEEYADCLSMLLCLFNYFEIDTLEVMDIEMSDDILLVFNEIIRMCTILMEKEEVTENILKKIFTYLLHIGKLLNLSDKNILDACYKKILKNEERLKTDY